MKEKESGEGRDNNFMRNKKLDQEEEFAIGKIKDLVSSKLNNMRSI